MSQIESRGSQGFESRQIVELEGGEKLIAERITDPNDPRIYKIQAILQNQFKKEEVDPVEVIQATIVGKDTKTDNEVSPYIVTVVQNEQEEIMALAMGNVLELLDESYEAKGKDAFVFGAYIVTVDKYRRKGLASQVFGFRLLQGEAEATKRGLNVVAYVGEVVDESEEFINSQGARRVYIQKDDDNYQEVPYIQPPLEYDPKTGKPAEGAGAVPEHLMLFLKSGVNTLSSEDLMSMVRAIYNNNNYKFEEAFTSKRAYNNHVRTIEEIEDELSKRISGRKLMLLSKAEREQLRAEGKTVIDHGSDVSH